MFIDSGELSENQLLQADVCIVGAGAAGISIAREFIGTNKKLIMLESGGLEYNHDIQSLYYGHNTGIPSFELYANRLRYFGGTTNHWAGHSRPLDPIDFEEKSWIPHSGWPITRNDLGSYYEQAQSILDLGDSLYEDLDLFLEKTKLEKLNFNNQLLKTVVYGQSPPTRFAKKYADDLKQAKNVKVLLHANALELITNDSGSTITGINVANFHKKTPFRIEAKNTILATGGMENARLLLLSNQTNPNGIGNDQDLVGRYFMDHILLRYGLDISLTHPDTNLQLYHQIHDIAKGKKFAILAASEQLINNEKLTNFRAHLYKTPPIYSVPIGGIFSDLDGYKGENKLEKSRDNSIGVRLVLEPMPNPDSRITLAYDRLDYFNQPQINVHWLVGESDLEHAYKALEVISLEFGRLGLGRGFSDIFKGKIHWPRSTEAGKHHCGTTRMADTAQTGVVDANCKVFGLDNLYVSGSSVFPTIGYANPTLTIVALALRLTDHIKSKLS